MMTANGAPNNSPLCVVVVDFQLHTRGGHFGSMMQWYVDQFTQRVDEVLIYTPNPQVTQLLFSVGHPKVSFHPLPFDQNKKITMNEVLADAVARRENCRLGAFFMWAVDLFILSKYTKHHSPCPWSLFGTFSRSARDLESKMGQYEALTLEFFNAHPDCVAIAQPDPFIESRSPKFITVIDGFDPMVARKRSDLGEAIRQFANGTMLIGTVGHLFGFRGVHEILNLASIHPHLRFVLAGKLVEESMHPDYLIALKANRCPNVLYLPGYIENDEVFNDVVAALDAVLIDGRTYPNQSGVCCKALAFGKHLLTPASNSWTDDVISRYRVGNAYANPQQDLLQPWQEWIREGGPDRSRQAIHELCNPSQNQRSMDLICAKLFPPDLAR